MATDRDELWSFSDEELRELATHFNPVVTATLRLRARAEAAHAEEVRELVRTLSWCRKGILEPDDWAGSVERQEFCDYLAELIERHTPREPEERTDVR